MFKNYFKIALRNLKKNKAYAFINISGLAVSICCGILIFMLVNYHLSFDNFHTDGDRIYRVVTEQHRDDISYTNSVPSPLGKVFRQDYTYAEKVARIATFEGQLVSLQKDSVIKKFREPEGLAFTEPEFFEIFNYPLVQGNIKTALVEPNTAVITEKMAKKYFGTENALSKIIRVDSRIDFKITGILKDLPENTDRRTEIYAAYANLKDFNSWLAGDDAWGGIQGGMNCYMKLKPSVTIKQVEDAMQTYVKKYRPTSKNVHHYKLQPLSDIHFNEHYGGSMEKKNLWVLSFIGLFLVVTACINFINLATAQAINRSKEIGIRKMLGSLRSQLFAQFIIETFAITLAATLLALGLATLLLPSVNNWFGVRIHINPFSDPVLMAFIVLLTIVVTLLAGSYPGFILSGFQPIAALKSKLNRSHTGGLNTRRSLIIVQFTISQVLIIGMIVIAMQMRYSKQSDLGFRKDAIVLIPIASRSQNTTIQTLKNQFETIPGVEKVTVCSAPPASLNGWSTMIKFENRDETEAFRVSVKSADESYVPVFDLQLVAGRNMFRADTVREGLANELLAQKLNLTPQELIGKFITVNETRVPVVGVVKNFHDQSFHEDLSPIFLPNWKEQFNTYAVKINPSHITTTLAALDKTWSRMHPDQLYEYQFLDEHIGRFYQTEELMLKLIEAFALIAIVIGCFGLYGLVMFIAAQKIKEIGIRKVLGGRLMHILWMFGKEFSLLIVTAFVIAAPVAWWLMNNWLKDFQYKISINAWIFISSILAIGLITALTIGFQAIKAAMANPVKSLRTE